MTVLTIENIIVTSQLAKKLDLATLATILPNTTYEPKEQDVLILHHTSPINAVVMLMPDGKLFCTGVKKLADAEIVVQKTVDLLQKENITVTKNPTVDVYQYVVSTHMNRTFNLEYVVEQFPDENIEYNPSVFPGVIYQMKKPNTVILVFDSGKLVCNGATMEDVSAAFDSIYDKLSSVRIK